MVMSHFKGVDNAHITGVGNCIRMVMSHFIALKKCGEARRVAFRKASLHYALRILVLTIYIN